MRIYQLIPAIAIQDHLLEPRRAATLSRPRWPEPTGPRAASLLNDGEKLGREGVRLAGQVAGLVEWTYQKAVLGLETTTVGVG